MSNLISGSPLAPGGTPLGGVAHRAPAAAGGMPTHDDAIVGVEMHSVFANAREELTAALPGRVPDKKLHQRSLKSSDDAQFLQRDRLREIVSVFAGDPGARRAGQGGDHAAHRHKLIDRIIKHPHRARQEAEDYTDYPTEQYLLLRDAQHRSGEQGSGGSDDEGRRQALREIASELFAEHSESILADVNTFAAISELRSTEAVAVRGAYQDAVVGSASLADTLARLVAAADGGQPEDFLRVHKSMVSALGLDMAAARSSTDKVKLQALASDLFHMATISTVIQRCGQSMTALAARFATPPVPATQLAGDLIRLTGERWVDAGRIQRLASQFGLESPPACAVQFMQSVRATVSSMPVQMFATPEARNSVLDAVQGALDAAIEREEGLA
jgi:type III secretion protein W